MKKIIYITAFILFGWVHIQAQQAPIAIDDYASVKLNQNLTLNVVTNDYHPNGLNFRVYQAPNSLSFTDSTITWHISYEKYFNVEDSIFFNYTLIDEEGNIDFQSITKVHLAIMDNDYFDFLDINNIRAKVNASGTQFYSGQDVSGTNDQSNVFEFPAGSGKKTIFNSTLWIGGKDETNNLHLAAERFRQNGLDFWPGPISNNPDGLNIDTNTVVNWQRVWKVNSDEIVYHRHHFDDKNYSIPEDILNWPAHGDQSLNQAEYLAPFVDVNNNKIYDPENGDYPLIRGDECIFFILNDLRSHGESTGDSLGIEIHVMAFAFKNSKPAFKNSIFYSYKVFNRSNIDYHDVYAGIYTDFDIGYAWDDFVGCDVKRGTYYAYNGDDTDGTNNEDEAYVGEIPVQGVVMLSDALMPADEIDNETGCNESINGLGFEDGIIDNEKYGLSSFIWYGNSAGSPSGDPVIAEDYYNYLQAIWKDGTAMEYGGNGHFSSGAYGPGAMFMFPGTSDDCYWGTDGVEPFGLVNWTEISANNQPSDRRGLGAFGPFNLKANSVQKFDLAYVAAFPNENVTALNQMLQYVDTIRKSYKVDGEYFGYQWLSTDEVLLQTNDIKLFPNPAHNLIHIRYNSKQTIKYRITNLSAKIVNEGELCNGQTNINIGMLPDGMYILSLNSNSKTVFKKFIKK